MNRIWGADLSSSPDRGFPPARNDERGRLLRVGSAFEAMMGTGRWLCARGYYHANAGSVLHAYTEQLLSRGPP